MSDEMLVALARQFDSETIRYVACDPASPAADTSRAGDARNNLNRIIMKMAEKTNFDMSKVKSAIEEFSSDIVTRVNLQGYYTKSDLEEFRRLAAM